MDACYSSRIIMATRRLAVVVVVCHVVAAGLAGCTDALRANTGHGGMSSVGGAKGTGGAVSAGGAVGAGSVLSGGGPAGGGGASGTDACAQLGHDYCVSDCLAEHAMPDNAICSRGGWTCRTGYILASSCPDRACGVIPNACCDPTTGVVSYNPCSTVGYRGLCPEGHTETYEGQAWCVPKTLTGTTCISLDRQPCSEPAVGCSDLSMGVVTCGCSLSGSDASSGIWYCSAFIGP
jgi:hypothetical protein